MGVSLLLELDGPSCEAFEEVSSIDVLPCGSGEGCHLFGLWRPLGFWPGEKWLQMAVPLPGVSSRVEQIEVTKVIILTKHGKR